MIYIVYLRVIVGGESVYDLNYYVLHNCMQSYYDCFSHPSAVWIMLYEALQIDAGGLFVKRPSSFFCRSALIRNTGVGECICC